MPLAGAQSNSLHMQPAQNGSGMNDQKALCNPTGENQAIPVNRPQII